MCIRDRFICSSIAHTFACVSPRAYKFLWKADYAGILVLWYARILFDSYFIMELCQHHFMMVSLGAFALLFGVLGVPVVTQKKMVCFVALFAIMHIPMITTLLSAQGSHPLLVSFALCNVLATLSGVVGFGIFATRVPEVWAPGTFDVWLHSHQLWHVLTTLGPLLSWRAGYFLLEYRRQTDGCVMVQEEFTPHWLLWSVNQTGH
eukprot:TRINITY_DN32477_c0_g1_i1.p1 TRINITY_DN32477_c0_g1~~TRINITY_DN32477_c0_g1_i1.p1  ORF type:complete len:205 (-),score=40.43 TRINITY_DN32477_c0_g1_i1:143-757(-)